MLNGKYGTKLKLSYHNLSNLTNKERNMNKVDWNALTEEHARLLQFYDNITSLYHDTISKHESTISIHAIGDLLLKLGEVKEVDIIG